jgi:exportin-2 (importin alpha re-exporter)
LAQVEVQQGFPLLLLKVISDEAVDQTIRVAGAVYFKNYIKRNWINVRITFIDNLFCKN